MTTTPTSDPKNTALVGAGVIPHVTVSNASEASAFYQRAFGAEEVARAGTPNGDRLIHCHLRINNGNLFINDAFPDHGHPLQTPQSFALHIQVDDIDTWFRRAVDAGATVVMPIDVMFWGDRYGQVKDPYGVLWSIGAPNR